MKFIKLHIKCHNDSEEAARLREIGVQSSSEYDYRLLKLRADYIVGYYPNTENGSFIFVVNGDELSVKETCDEIDKLI